MKLSLKTITFTVVAAALGVWAPAHAQAQLPVFGMIGLAEGQFAALNLVLVQSPDELHPGCRVIASFVDRNGQVFTDPGGTAARRLVTLQPQIAKQFKLYAAQILTAGETRKAIRAVLTPVPNTAVPSDCTCLVANVELVDPNGQTTVVDYGRAPEDSGTTPPPVPLPPGSGGGCTVLPD